MRTVSFSIANYCVPCHAHCQYCLLSSCGQVSGVDYRRSEEPAHRVLTELAEKGRIFQAVFTSDTVWTPRIFGIVLTSPESIIP